MFYIVTTFLKFVFLFIILKNFVSMVRESYIRVTRERTDQEYAALLQQATRRKLSLRTYKKRFVSPPTTRSRTKKQD